MPRPQFSLQRLLAVLTSCCLALGAWTFFSPSVGARPAATGEIIRIQGKFFDSSGRDWETCFVTITKPARRGGNDIYQSRGVQVKRRWLGCYFLDLELPPVDEAGKYHIFVSRLCMWGEKKTLHGRATIYAKQ